MKYISTRGGVEALSSAQAIKKGIADNGGLFVPDHIPLLTDALFVKLVPMTYDKSDGTYKPADGERPPRLFFKWRILFD